jgi:hypothetical protein
MNENLISRTFLEYFPKLKSSIPELLVYAKKKNEVITDANVKFFILDYVSGGSCSKIANPS